ncbi:MAG TPA: TIGR03435 family protein [Acidobacteriaceae bacterium]|jgi:uncharacterized protein (TIGR03435 family)|nr:TIGR03435 family protein [Acidobacteriaceae bacterium]
MGLLVLRFFAGLGMAALGVCISGAQLLPEQDVTHQLVLPKEGETVPSFEVATVRAAAFSNGMRVDWGENGYRAENITLRSVICGAYGANSDAQLVGGPDALLDGHFDIHAKTDANDLAAMKKMSPEDRQRQTSLMMQSLLAERFHLRVHIETRELPVYALVVAKSGSKLKASAPEPPKADEDVAPAAPAASPDQLPQKAPRGGSMMRMSTTRAEDMVSDGTMEMLATVLSTQPEADGRLVIDGTGLTGKYDWDLEWAPVHTAGSTKGTDGLPVEADPPSLLTALEEQLGLKLEKQKGPVQVVVIDHVEAPSAN